MIEIFIPGTPAPQGSIKFWGTSKAGRGILTTACARTKPWRAAIIAALTGGDGRPLEQFDGGVIVAYEFVMPRITALPKRRDAPPHTKKPDVDKLQRAVNDALKASGVIGDDSCIVAGQYLKRYADIGETAGLHLCVSAASDDVDLYRCIEKHVD